ncbi:L,D-transpeptidase [Oricola sp.]|uniref:L,D-transpeptidase n=1 Tax=Oricola sp. TaxID=1979950 RepID=UPI003BAD2FC6
MISRRQFLNQSALLTAGVAASSCSTIEVFDTPPLAIGSNLPPAATMYAGLSDGGFNIPAVPYQQVPKKFHRQIVRNRTGEGPGTIVVETRRHHLYYTQDDGTAVRYGVGLGRAGFEWSGRATMQWKRRWPTWTPPAEMIAREPDLKKYSAANGGMRPGLMNPLGARALYIFQDGRDTLYRLHGSPEWNSIGRSVSSGCVRLMNQDVIDLYRRVPNGTPIVVR